MTATPPRALLVDALAGSLGEEVHVMAYARNVDGPNLLTVMVRLDEVVPFPEAAGSMNLYRFTLILLTPLTDDTGPAEDELDALLEDVLWAIDRNTALPQWTRAARGMWLETNHPTYEVALQIPTEKAEAP